MILRIMRDGFVYDLLNERVTEAELLTLMTLALLNYFNVFNVILIMIVMQ